jgi:hypothetical protein
MEEKKRFLRLEKGRVSNYDEYDEIPLGDQTTVIGRSPGLKDTDFGHPDIEINDDFVSRSHIRISYIESDEAYILKERRRPYMAGQEWPQLSCPV